MKAFLRTLGTLSQGMLFLHGHVGIARPSADPQPSAEAPVPSGPSPDRAIAPSAASASPPPCEPLLCR